MGSGLLSIFSVFGRKNKNKVEEPVEKIGRKVIQVYREEDGSLVGTYNDILTACRILKLSKASVEMCLAGAQKFHRGYSFKEVEI